MPSLPCAHLPVFPQSDGSCVSCLLLDDCARYTTGSGATNVAGIITAEGLCPKGSETRPACTACAAGFYGVGGRGVHHFVWATKPASSCTSIMCDAMKHSTSEVCLRTFGAARCFAPYYCVPCSSLNGLLVNPFVLRLLRVPLQSSASPTRKLQVCDAGVGWEHGRDGGSPHHLLHPPQSPR